MATRRRPKFGKPVGLRPTSPNRGRGSSLYNSQVPKRARDSEDRYDSNQRELSWVRRSQAPKGLNGSETQFYNSAIAEREKELRSRTPLTDAENRSKKINSDLAKSHAAAEADNKRMSAESQSKYGEPSAKYVASERVKSNNERYESYRKADESNAKNTKRNAEYDRAKRALAVKQLKGKKGALK